MTRKIAAGCFAAMFALAVSASAQTPSSPQTPPSQPPSTPAQPPSSPSSPYPSGQASSMSERGGTKITGCVQAGTAANSFELTNVKKEGASASSSSSSSPSSSSSSDKSTVKLVASPSVDLSTHVGHTVEVSGKWAAGGASSSPSESPSASSSSSMGKEFQVSSVKMVSSTCSAGTN